MFGALLTFGGLFDDGWAAVAIVAFTLLVARPVAIFAALVRTKTDVPTRAFMAWFGPKGVATMTFSLLVLADTGIAANERLFNLAALVVFCLDHRARPHRHAGRQLDRPARGAGAEADARPSPPRAGGQLAGVKRGLVLGAREGPGPGALLAEREAQLARGAQALGAVGPEGPAGRVEVEGAEAELAEVAVLATRLGSGGPALRHSSEIRLARHSQAI